MQINKKKCIFNVGLSGEKKKRELDSVTWPGFHFKITRNVGRLGNFMSEIKYCWWSRRRLKAFYLSQILCIIGSKIIVFVRHTVGLIIAF